MKHLCLSIFVFSLCLSSYAGAESAFRDIPMEEVQAAFNHPTPPHPRLFITNQQLAEIQTKLKSQPHLQIFYQAMLTKADDILDQTPVKRVKTGRRLLSVSRRCLDRVIHLSAAYRFTGKQSYLRRAEKEMLAAAAFSDWNPSHFLDVAEMTAALAIGYDWLYDGLSNASRQTIRLAILEKWGASSGHLPHRAVSISPATVSGSRESPIRFASRNTPANTFAGSSNGLYAVGFRGRRASESSWAVLNNSQFHLNY